ncbi:hypothetical protein BDN71DRAFT_1586240, partial [Pleurotus eryngii]
MGASCDVELGHMPDSTEMSYASDSRTGSSLRDRDRRTPGRIMSFAQKAQCRLQRHEEASCGDSASGTDFWHHASDASEKSQKCLSRLFGYFCGLRAPLKPFRSHVPSFLLLSGTFLSPKGPKRPQKARQKAKFDLPHSCSLAQIPRATRDFDNGWRRCVLPLRHRQTDETAPRPGVPPYRCSPGRVQISFRFIGRRCTAAAPV